MAYKSDFFIVHNLPLMQELYMKQCTLFEEVQDSSGANPTKGKQKNLIRCTFRNFYTEENLSFSYFHVPSPIRRVKKETRDKWLKLFMPHHAQIIRSIQYNTTS